MKYYIYISDTKVDMLLPQVPHDVKKKVATEFGIDLKLLTAKHKTEEESDENRISRLEAVVKFIKEYGNVGTVDKPDQYIEDTLPMRWGPYDKFVAAEPSVVYFGGETDRTVFGLGGSLHHVIGNVGTSQSSASASLAPFLLSYLGKNPATGESEANGGEISGAQTDLDGEFAREVVYLTTRGMKGPSQRLEFLAKRLLQGPSPHPDRDKRAGMQVLLATPLYVSMAD
jgi:hypothetical protein